MDPDQTQHFPASDLDQHLFAQACLSKYVGLIRIFDQIEPPTPHKEFWIRPRCFCSLKESSDILHRICERRAKAMLK